VVLVAPVGPTGVRATLAIDDAAGYGADMTVWQYAQLRVTYNSRLAAGGGKWTIAWYEPDAPKLARAVDYRDVVAELNCVGTQGWELVGVAALDVGDSRRSPAESEWSLTTYTFRRPSNATAKKSTEPIQRGEDRQRWPIKVAALAHPQQDSLAGSKTTEPVTLVRLTGYWLLDSEPVGSLAEGHDPEWAAGRLLIWYKAVRSYSQADIDVVESLRVEYQNPDVSADRRERIEAAAADYAASWVEGEFGVTRWQSPQSFPLSRAADLLDDSAEWLRGRVEDPLADAASTVRAPGPLAEIGAGMTADFVTAPLTVPLESAARACEIAGIVIGLATGAHPLAMACAHRLANDETGRLLSKGFEQVITSIDADRDRSATAKPVGGRSLPHPDQDPGRRAPRLAGSRELAPSGPGAAPPPGAAVPTSEPQRSTRGPGPSQGPKSSPGAPERPPSGPSGAPGRR
jgi:hypothetical protein